MFERFTDRARRVVVLAQEEARLLAHDYIGTEHILLGLIHEGDGIAAQALRGLGVGLDDARAGIEGITGRGDSPPSSHIAFTPRAKKVLELSLREAMTLGHNYIGTEHILLGLVREGEGVGAQILLRRGVDLATARAHVLSLLSGAAGSREAVPDPAAVDEPSAPPRCPRCRSALAESVAYRVLEVPDHDGNGNVALMFVFCRSCGTTVGTIAPT